MTSALTQVITLLPKEHLDVQRPPQAQHVGGQLAARLALLHSRARQTGEEAAGESGLPVRLGAQDESLSSLLQKLSSHPNQHVSQVGPTQSLPHAVVVGGCITGNQGASSLAQMCESVTQAGGSDASHPPLRQPPASIPAGLASLSPPFHTQVAACTDSAWCDSSGSRLMRPMTCCPQGCCVRLTGSHASSSLGASRWGAAAGAQAEPVVKRAGACMNSCRWGQTSHRHHSCSLHCSPGSPPSPAGGLHGQVLALQQRGIQVQHHRHLPRRNGLRNEAHAVYLQLGSRDAQACE